MRASSSCVLALLLAAGPAAAETVSFVAFGDTGFGSPAQYAVGKAIAQVCAARGCEFSIGLGDNIYPNGVGSADDPQFEEKFEKPYADLKMPMYMTLGNHDNSSAKGGEGSNNARGDFQVAYAQRQDRASGKWHMPARYYSFTAPLKSRKHRPLAQFFALDSSPLSPEDPDPDPRWSAEHYGAAELAWFDRALRASKARWRIAFAHHTYVSNGRHGTSKPLRDFVQRSICADGADLFIAGHNHDLEWLKSPPECSKTRFIVSGAGAAPRVLVDPPPYPAYWQAGEKLGFWWIRLDAKQMTAAAFTLNSDNTLPLDGKGKPVPAFEKTVPR